MTDKDLATVLEEAADVLLVRGVRRDGMAGGMTGGPVCVLGAIHVAVGSDESTPEVDEAFEAVLERRFPDQDCCALFDWNDSTTDDFEVIDAVRRVAKDLRNEATS